jgi:hypothetical protein
MFRSLLPVRLRLDASLVLALTVGSSLVAAASCATSQQAGHGFQTTGPDSSVQGGDDGGGGSQFGDDGGGFSPFPAYDAGPEGGHADFPSAPIMDPNGAPSSDPSALFPGNGSSDSTSGAPCMSEPANGALVPYNWLRPRVYWTAPTSETVFQVRISSPSEANDLVVYTTKNYYALDKTLWQTLAGVEGGLPGHLVGQTLTFVVRGVSASGGTPSISNSATIQIAPAIADGSLIFWSTASFAANAASTNLQGFHVGDEGTTAALTVPQVQQKVWAIPPDGGNFPNPPVLEGVGCIGCHTSTPDGNYVGFTAQWPWPNAIASVNAEAGAPVGVAPPWLTPGAIANLGPNTNDANWCGGMYVNSSTCDPNNPKTNNVDNVELGIQTFSPAHYKTGDRIEIASVGASKDEPNVPNSNPPKSAGISAACVGGTSPCVVSQLAWINLEWNGAADAGSRPSAAPGAPSNGGWGILARTGEDSARSAGTPNWSNDGTTVAYTSVIGGTMDGRLDQPTSGNADIYTIPYSANAGPGGAGGKATPFPGASDSTLNEYFPAFAPDDSLIAFDGVASSLSMYNQPAAEVYVVPFNGGAGGKAVRLAANDPVACTGLKSPGVQNTWPKWAPNPIPPEAGAPAPQTINGYTYYWVTFSSTRSVTAGATATTPGKQQLYVAGVVVDSMGNISTFAPIYLWNQDDTVNNLIPAWGEFAILPGLMPPPPPPNPQVN